MSFWKFSMFLDFFFYKKNLKNKTTKNRNKTCPQLIEMIKSGTSQQYLPWRIFSHSYSTSLWLCRWKFMRSKVYLRNYTNLLRKTKILQIPFTSQQAQIFQKNMKQFIWTYGRRNIIIYPRLKYRIFKFQFMTIRTNVTMDATKVANRNKFRNISTNVHISTNGK